MGFFKDLGRSLGLVSPKKQQSYGGPRPNTSPLDTEAGQLYYKTIKDRLAGIGVGPEEYLIDINAATNPYAESRRANYANYEIPAISAQSSARGLGRSTIPVNRIALGQQEIGRDVAEKLAQYDVANKATQQQNAYLRRNEINDALVRMGEAGEAQANALNNAALFTYNDWAKNEAARLGLADETQAGAGKALQTAADLIAGAVSGGLNGGGFTGATLGGLSSLANGGMSYDKDSTDALTEYLNQLLNPDAGMVRISGGVNRNAYVPIAPADYYKKYST